MAGAAVVLDLLEYLVHPALKVVQVLLHQSPVPQLLELAVVVVVVDGINTTVAQTPAELEEVVPVVTVVAKQQEQQTLAEVVVALVVPVMALLEVD